MSKQCINPSFFIDENTVLDEDNCKTELAVPERRRTWLDDVGLSPKEIMEVKSILGLAGNSSAKSKKIYVSEKRQTCLCYGITAEDDPMTAYKKVMAGLER